METFGQSSIAAISPGPTANITKENSLVMAIQKTGDRQLTEVVSEEEEESVKPSRGR